MSRPCPTSRRSALATVVLAVGVTLALGAVPASAASSKGASLNSPIQTGASLN